MKFTNFIFLLLLAVAIGACTAGTEQRKSDGKTDVKTEKKDETKKDKSTSGVTIVSPKAAIETIVNGVKAKDESMIKSALAKNTVAMFENMAKESKKTFYEVMTEGEEDAMKRLPEMRNEKIDGDKASIEMKEADAKEWGTINFVKENGNWKLSLFSDEDMKEKEEMDDKADGTEKKQP